MIHHTAIAVKDFRKSYHFYTQVMGFRLVAGVKRQAPGGGWTKHMFLDQGDGSLFAIWDLKGIEGVLIQPDEWRSGISTGLGLPGWVNHFAFQVSGQEEFDRCKQRWLDNGYHVSETDHAFIRSCYTYDPDGNWVEWTFKLREINDADRIEAEEILADDTPSTVPDYKGSFTRSTVPKWTPDGRSAVTPA